MQMHEYHIKLKNVHKCELHTDIFKTGKSVSAGATVALFLLGHCFVVSLIKIFEKYRNYLQRILNISTILFSGYSTWRMENAENSSFYYKNFQINWKNRPRHIYAVFCNDFRKFWTLSQSSHSVFLNGTAWLMIMCTYVIVLVVLIPVFDSISYTPIFYCHFILTLS